MLRAVSKSALRYLWRNLPLGKDLRQRILTAYATQLLPRFLPAAEKATEPGPLVVAGLLRSALGLGEAARQLAAGLSSAGLAPELVDISGRIAPRDHDGDMPTQPPSPPGGVLILCVNAPEVGHALVELGPTGYLGRYRIGYWHWELPVLPRSWRVPTRLLDEVWVSSTFTAQAARQALPIPIMVVPPKLERLPPGPGRSELGLPEDRLVVYSAFDMRSSLERKNPLAAVQAFRRAFGDSDEAVLLLKANRLDRGHPVFAPLAQAIGEAPNIRLIDEIWSRERLHHVMQQIDVVLSLHRAEGFGLSLAEGMAYGKVAIATDWSGNTDFMDESCALPVPYRLIPVSDPQGIYKGRGLGDAVWAAPDIEAAASHLRRVADDPALRAALGEAARQRIDSLVTPQDLRQRLGSNLLWRVGACP